MSTTQNAELSSLMERFAPCTKELLTQRSLLERTDTKFLLPAQSIGDLLEGLQDDYTVLQAGSEFIASYETLYFDTQELMCFHAHRRGRRARHKVRVRHYPDRGLSYLEIKTKRGPRMTSKYRATKPYGDNSLGDAELEFIQAHCDLPADELAQQIWTNFHRLTLIGLHTNERVTVDLDLQIGPEDTLETVHGVAILEVKQAPFCVRTPIMQAIRSAGFRPASASKYCTAIAFTRDGLRMNRLLPALRTIEKLRQ